MNHFKFPRKFTQGSIAGLIQTAIVLGVPAVYSSAAGAQALEEVIVTARKREESLQDTPISITAFSNSDLEARGINDLGEIGRYTPNMVFDFTSAINPTSSAASIYIRGVGQPDWSLPTDPGVGMYLDGVYIARSTGAVLDLLEVQSIEVLKGPQGTLFGKNTIGGAISVTSRKPDDEFEAKFSVGVGSFSRTNLRGFINVPVTDTFAFNAAVSSKVADGFIKNRDNHPDSPDIGDEDSLAARVAFRWTPTDDITVDVSADGTKEREENTSNVHFETYENAFLPLVYNGVLTAESGAIFSDPTRFGFVPDPVCADYGDPSRLTNPTCFNSQWEVSRNDPYNTYARFKSNVPEMNALASDRVRPAAEMDLWGVSARVSWAIDDSLELVSITAYRDQEGFWTRDEDGTPIELLSTVNDFEQDQFSQEFQLLGQSFDDRLNWILGAFYLEEEGCHLDLVYLYGESLTSGGCIDNQSTAVFAQGTYDFTDQLSLTLGARYTDDQKSYSPDSVVLRSELVGLPIGSPLLPFGRKEKNVEEVNVKINLSYRWSDTLMTYASYGDGFKGATFTQRIFPNFDFVPTADPEFVETYEIGFKSEFADNRIRVNGALFFTDYEDIQVTVLEEGNAGNTTANAAEGEILGFELEVKAVPTANVLLETSIGYLDAEYTEVAGVAAVNGVTTDSELVNTPEWSISAAAAYTFDLSGGWILTPRIDYSFTSKVYNDAQNFEVISQNSIGLWDSSIRLENDTNGWMAMLQVRNLTDELVIDSGFADPGFTGNSEATLLPPKTWLFTVGYTFR